MFALLEKDWRLNRAPVIGTALYLAVACPIGVYLTIGSGNYWGIPFSWRLADGLNGAAELGMWALVAFSAAFGGVTFALERRERWSDFLAVLPASRLRIVASKLTVALVCILLAFGFNFALFFISEAIRAEAMRTSVGAILNMMIATMVTGDEASQQMYVAAAIGFMAFGIGWMLSAFLASPAISASVAIGVAALSNLMIAKIVAGENESFSWMVGWSLLAGTIALLSGTVYFVKRFEP